MTDVTAYVALGSNLGDRAAYLAAAVGALRTWPGIDAVRASPVYETAAHTLRPGEAQPAYLNAVAELTTRLGPEELLAACLTIERQHGRDRSRGRWAPRTLDLDLIAYGHETLATPGLVLPHPRLAERRFVLQPLADLAPNLRLPPPLDATAAELLARCPDRTTPLRTSYRLDAPPGEKPDA